MNIEISKRIGAVLILCICALYAPFWLTALLGITCIVYFRNFYEAVFIGLLTDLLYGIPEARFGGWKLVGFGLFLIVYLIMNFLKKKMSSRGTYKIK